MEVIDSLKKWNCINIINGVVFDTTIQATIQGDSQILMRHENMPW